MKPVTTGLDLQPILDIHRCRHDGPPRAAAPTAAQDARPEATWLARQQEISADSVVELSANDDPSLARTWPRWPAGGRALRADLRAGRARTRRVIASAFLCVSPVPERSIGSGFSIVALGSIDRAW